MRLAVIAAFAMCPGVVFAQEGPTFDCAKAEHEAEIAICENAELAALDRDMANVYGAALEVAGGLDAGAEEAVAELKAYQRGWIGGRDECWKDDDIVACIEQSYQRREAELVAMWMLQDPLETSTWMCEGGPEVVTMFYDTMLASVRMEIGDTIDVGTVTRTASGAKYDGSFGRSIWIKGNEALYHEASPNDADYTCARVE
ncbi:MAG: lysozyme inhibitor LprI family protein [Pseudomonadota bacterium]|nr:lysozyme inhibitor LprI family protein [Pseudomonadota bacterium]